MRLREADIGLSSRGDDGDGPQNYSVRRSCWTRLRITAGETNYLSLRLDGDAARELSW